MRLIADGVLGALHRLLSGDAELWGIAGRSLAISLGATVVAFLVGVPAGLHIVMAHPRLKRPLATLLFAGMGLPTVLVGLVLTLLLWREGPLGSLDLLYTPWAILVGQVCIALPVIAGLTAASVDALDPRIPLQVRALGAGTFQTARLLAAEARAGIAVAAAAGFGHALSEVGAAMMLGGNVAGSTRVLTTATVLEARMGRFDAAIGLGALLLAISLAANALVVFLGMPRREAR